MKQPKIHQNDIAVSNQDLDTPSSIIFNDPLMKTFNKLSVRPGRSLRRKSMIPSRIGIIRKDKGLNKNDQVI